MGFLEPEYVQCHNYGFLGIFILTAFFTSCLLLVKRNFSACCGFLSMVAVECPF